MGRDLLKAKRRKLDNFNMDNPVDRWLKFLAEPEKLITMQKFDISVYPNLLKAVELLDRSNFTVEQQIAYDRHWFAVADINQTRIDSFDEGFEKGEEQGIGIGIEQGKLLGRIDGLQLSREIMKEHRNGKLSHEEIALKFSIPVDEVKLMLEEG